jgi:hypothetical protein
MESGDDQSRVVMTDSHEYELELETERRKRNARRLAMLRGTTVDRLTEKTNEAIEDALARLGVKTD